ncbi:beta-mannosidase [Amphibacillus sp. Q70]|uniref:beta-mannosidase n=1 Tax=Amphibacillus sp. Q70 TaxID=3453416 RepID=UPI003F86867F
MKKIKLTIQDWQFRQLNEGDWLEAVVPGFVHTDLRTHGLIDDPFYGTNERDQQWIDKQEWEYQSTFSVDQNLLKQDRIELIFHGLDTYATVYLNNEIILETENMFRVYRKEVKSLLTEGENQLRIHFKSPVDVDLPKLKALGYGLPAANDDSEMGELGDHQISIFARKAPYHYGWDWGPRFVTSGIWRNVELVAWFEINIDDFYLNQRSVSNEKAELTAELEVESVSNWQGELQITTGELSWRKNVQLKAGKNKVTLELAIDQPKLWWSRGLGDPNQYTFVAEFKQADQLFAERMITTGLRSVRLVRDRDQAGTSFYFELNGVPVFAKGANHIPNDSFVTEVTEERYHYEIESAVAANMNMLRVWGGGIYEPEIFYRLCDEHGIMVWQDFMFACSMYPGDQAFLANVEQEAKDNVKRLRSHPSIVLWCGNNEIDSAWAHFNEQAGWGWKNDYDHQIREKLWADYQTIFDQILADVTTEYAPNEPYWPSSPLADLTGDIHQHATGVGGSGDVHYWDVWHGKKPFEDYHTHVGRFMSEYGFQSFPELRTVETFAEEADYAIESKVMLHHQKNGAGNQLIKTYMDRYLPEPKDFPAFLYMSQVLQAEGIKQAIEAHRRRMPYCMGTLYWQINDCWPVASWSSIDYYGRWKALHYYAKAAFKDEMLSFQQTENQLDVYVVTDKLVKKTAKLKLTLQNLTGDILHEELAAIEIKPNQSMIVKTIAIDRLTQDYDQASLVMVGELTIEKELVDRKRHYFVPTKALPLPEPKVTIKQLDSYGQFEISTDQFAKSIWLDTEETGYFSDNYFDLLPGERKFVQFIPRDDKLKPDMNIQAKSMSDMI